jgi:protein-S-isoprenylcysteine O-methyltransferase Ste14
VAITGTGVILLGGLTVFRILAVIREGNCMAFLLAAHSGLAAALLLSRRKEPNTDEGSATSWLAWSSALLPLLMHTGRGGGLFLQVLNAAGVLLSIWGLASLGKSFGIAPADRGLVQCGAYRLVRHPMYLGELVSATCACLAHPFERWNLAVLLIFTSALILRILQEEKILTGYPEYASQVRWRLLPGIW